MRERIMTINKEKKTIFMKIQGGCKNKHQKKQNSHLAPMCVISCPFNNNNKILGISYIILHVNDDNSQYHRILSLVQIMTKINFHKTSMT